MKKKLATYVILSIGILLGLAGALVGVFWGQFRANMVPENISKGIAIQQEGIAGLQLELSTRITSAPARVMNQSGLAGVMGGAHVKLSSGDPQEILLPIPQLADGQVPLCYFISSTPPDAVTEFRLRKREDCNVVVSVRLVGKNREVQIAWSSVVLLGPRNITPNTTPADPYRKATSCVQAQADDITKLATNTWPDIGKASEFAANIQRHIRAMKRKEQPHSLDALGILHSGESGICTANANLASALMRSKGIACRSIAVIPPTSQRLEMHRIVEFAENGRWLPFDPSSLQTEIPTKPWQYIIMAKTTTSDEQMAMKPRMGAMVGCPYGQEIEILSSGVNLCGQDFFWTMAKPLAEFETTEEASRLAAAAWTRYLETGTLTQGQLKATSAKTATELVEHLQMK
jgi:Transglutaminase-like superfamily